MLTFQFTVDEINHILMLLGRLPFADVNSVIKNIVLQGQPQAEALGAEDEEEDKDKAE
jgi:hypothetical protein